VPALLVVALLDGVPARWTGALIGSAALFAFTLMLALAAPGGMGMGDVELAAPT